MHSTTAMSDMSTHTPRPLPTFPFSDVRLLSDKNDPATWASTDFKMAKLTEEDRNNIFDCPPLKDQDEVAADLQYKRTSKVNEKRNKPNAPKNNKKKTKSYLKKREEINEKKRKILYT